MSTISITFKYLGGDTTGGTTVFYEGNLYALTGTVTIPFEDRYLMKVTGADREAQTALSFADTFVANFKDLIPGLRREISGNTVRLTADTGTFTSAVQSGNLYTITSAVDDVFDLAWNVREVESQGNCTTLRYSIDFAVGGAQPYRVTLLNNGNSVLAESWDGQTPIIFDAQRGFRTRILLRDFNGDEIVEEFTTAYRLQPQDFDVQVRSFVNSSDVIVQQNVFREGTFTEDEPITFSLVGFNTPVEDVVDWQQSNVFAGIIPGVYKLYVKDKYGCYSQWAISVIVNEFDPIPQEEDEARIYFSVSELNSLSFKTEVEFNNENRKNFKTTLSFEEAVRLPHQAIFRFLEGENIQTQFKSSYPFHAITLYKCDGTSEAIPYTMIQENIGIFERVDAIAFAIDQGTTDERIGIYFDGGNVYDPVTEEVIGLSPYFQNLPEWAVSGDIIEVESSTTSYGARTITAGRQAALFDQDRNTLYFEVDGVLGENEIPVIVEARYNRQPYNVFRFDFTMFDGSGYVRIEPGFDENNIDLNNVRVSENFTVLDDTEHWAEVRWYLNRSVGEAVAYDSFEGRMWLQGRLRPFSVGSAETLDADDQTRSLDQDQRLGFRFDVKLLEPRKWNKLLLASAIGNRGTFIIEDLSLVRTSSPEQEELGLTNKSNIVVEFAAALETSKTAPTNPVIDVPIGTPEEPQEPVDFNGIYMASVFDRSVLIKMPDGRFWIPFRV